MSAASVATVIAKNVPQQGVIRSLALSVHFKNPDFGMKQYEVLSRATAFLLSVDPFYEPPEEDRGGIYDHLGSSDKRRMERNFKRTYAVEPAGGPPGRTPEQLGWLEFCPTKFRPVVHCVASSHVLAPWRWPKFYPQEWLRHIEQKHCVYSLEVLCPTKLEALAKYALNPYSIHHPDGLDLAVIHLKEEEAALKQMEHLGVEMLYLRDLEKDQTFKGEEFKFEGFQVAETDLAESGDFKVNNNDEENSYDEFKKKENYNDGNQGDNNVDDRVFIPYTEIGQLLFGTRDRILATTSKPLPQGLCGGPVLDANNRVAGVVEGIVPLNHDDTRIAGSSVFIPSIQLRHFLDTYAERIMLQHIMPEDFFERVERLKQGLSFREKDTLEPAGPIHKKEQDGKMMQDMLDEFLANMKKHHTPEETNATMAIVRRERQEVLKILDSEGGDVDEVVARVRKQTRMKQNEELKRLIEEQEKNSSGSSSGEDGNGSNENQLIDTNSPKK